MRSASFVLLMFGPTLSLFSQHTDSILDRSISVTAGYISDNVKNISGGIEQEYGYLGMATFDLYFISDKSGLWKNGVFYVKAVNTHGSVPSSEFIGDVQIVSNIEAGNHTYIQEMWYRHSSGRIEFTVGLQDLNSDFANTENGALFLNSSFGVSPVISGNISAPIFPLTTIGLTANWNLTGESSLLMALYDGRPSGFDTNPYNLRWNYHRGDGMLAISEFQHITGIKDNPGLYKLGIFAHNHILEKNFSENYQDSAYNNVVGLYIHGDQQIWTNNSKHVGFFFQGGISPSETVMHNSYLGLGIKASGFLSRSYNDEIGLAIARAGITSGQGCETTIELTWKNKIHEKISVQPDLQYIIHPSGRLSNLKNSLTGIIRIEISIK
ncbi:MAG: hypothetical protein CVU05_11325 [Bacteroidetes bacterium HGW-Bacteroidetes-21]|jgi:porin|nr:MAG: hypothetical protein CVU05_11325 [Bacteroidetes bacterium HGW-Bacteroidetes-21]